MPFGKDDPAQRAAARKHLKRLHVCPRCGREVAGNAYSNHKRACFGAQQNNKETPPHGTHQSPTQG